ncbi:MAG: radical SAM protein, partial [Candidatus Methanomethylicota archaeon]
LLAEEVKHLLADVVFIGSSCDPYQPCEEKYEITRKCLEILLRNNWPIEIGTKSKLILRDLDLLKRFKETSFCCVFVTITCLDEKLSKLLEPNVPSPLERLSVIKQLSDEGVETVSA